MGIRVHQYLGFGVDNVKVTKPRGYGSPKIKDPRFALKSWLRLSESAYDMESGECLDWIKANEVGLLDFYRQVTNDPFGESKLKVLVSCAEERILQTQRRPCTFQHLVYCEEFGEPEVLMFVPFTCEHWQRYNDDIDYHFETILHKQGPHHHFIEGTLYPWPSWVVDGDLPSEVRDHLLKLNPKRDQWGRLSDLCLRQLELYVDETVVAELKSRLRPELPLEACVMVYFWRAIFRDPVAFAKELRPMVYTYWA